MSEQLPGTGAFWQQYYIAPANKRAFPDEDLCRFLHWTKTYWASLEKTLMLGIKLHILDYGCGDGRNAAAVKHFFPKSVLLGVDFKYSNIALNRRKFYDAFLTVQEWDDLSKQEPNVYEDTPIVPNTVKFDIIVDCMTSQHFSWAKHRSIYTEFSTRMYPYSTFFLKHLDSTTSDVLYGEVDETDKYTFLNIKDAPRACYPNNGLVCMPPAAELVNVLEEVALKPKEITYLVRVSGSYDSYLTRIFSHTVLYCIRQDKKRSDCENTEQLSSE